jgi:hypothetical protein
MILESTFMGLFVVYLLAWAVGAVEGILFGRFLRREHPEIAKIHAPGFLRGNLSSGFRSTGWILSRRYRTEDLATLNHRGDLHRRFLLGSLSVMLLTVVGMFIVGSQIANKPKGSNEEAEQAGDGDAYQRPC